MAKPRLTVTTPEGTFTRQTARNYSHIVICGPARHEVLESERKRNLSHYSKAARLYSQLKDVDGRPLEDRWLDRAAEWAASEAKRAAHLANMGPITEDADTCGVLSWNGRLDLAMAEARRDTSSRFRWVKIYEVATGALVASFQNGPAPSPREVAVAAASGEIFETAKAITDREREEAEGMAQARKWDAELAKAIQDGRVTFHEPEADQDAKAAQALADFQKEFGGPAVPKPALDVKVGDMVKVDTPNGEYIGQVGEIYSVIGQAYLRASVVLGSGLNLTVPLPIVEVLTR